MAKWTGGHKKTYDPHINENAPAAELESDTIKTGLKHAMVMKTKHSPPLCACMTVCTALQIEWWRHQMETFSVLLAICAGNSPVPVEFPAQRPLTRSFDVFLDLHSNKRLSKQWRGWWFESQWCPLWRHRNGAPKYWPVYCFGLYPRWVT